MADFLPNLCYLVFTFVNSFIQVRLVEAQVEEIVHLTQRYEPRFVHSLRVLQDISVFQPCIVTCEQLLVFNSKKLSHSISFEVIQIGFIIV